MNKKPYYKESAKILALIKKSKRILINCHRSPDLDSVGCASELCETLNQMGKRVTIVCPTDFLEEYKFFKYAGKIQVIDFRAFDFNDVDWFIVLDTQNVCQLTGSWEIGQPDIQTIIIDHHPGNRLKGSVRLFDQGQFSCAEILFRVFQDWRVSITKTVATGLFAGIFGDTTFSIPKYPPETLEIAAELVRLGADKDGIIQKVYRNYPLETLRLSGTILSRLQRDRTRPLAWSALSADEYGAHGKPRQVKSLIADTFLSSIKDVELAILFVEDPKGFVKMSYRSRGNFDCVQLAKQFGGGGHRRASGGFVKGDLLGVVRNVLKEARRLMHYKRL